MSFVKLNGGRDGIFKKNNTVIRPSIESTPYIHELLKSIYENGFIHAPIPHGYQNGVEEISFIKGDVYNDILPIDIRSDETLQSIASLLKNYHDATLDYVSKLKGNEIWMIEIEKPIEVMCHGDIAPYNITMNGKLAAGIIDFDTLHPGPRISDIAYALYRWVPLTSPENALDFGDVDSKIRRVNIFLEQYGVKQYSLSTIIDTIITKLESLIEYMKKQAANKNEKFIKDLEEGHHLTYEMDIAFLRKLMKNRIR